MVDGSPSQPGRSLTVNVVTLYGEVQSYALKVKASFSSAALSQRRVFSPNLSNLLLVLVYLSDGMLGWKFRFVNGKNIWSDRVKCGVSKSVAGKAVAIFHFSSLSSCKQYPGDKQGGQHG